LVCIPTRQQPLLCEHFPNHRHLLAERERRKILAVERVVIALEPDDADFHPAAALGDTLVRLGARCTFHAGCFDLPPAKHYSDRDRGKQPVG
jgi:hypothetical protein